MKAVQMGAECRRYRVGAAAPSLDECHCNSHIPDTGAKLRKPCKLAQPDPRWEAKPQPIGAGAARKTLLLRRISPAAITRAIRAGLLATSSRTSKVWARVRRARSCPS